jgi:thioredoxin reductase (NADPH)
MTKPVILTVDDEPEVLNMINRDLRRHFGKDYRIVNANSGQSALDTVKQLKIRNEPVALMLSDQRMPQISGTEFLRQAMQFYPDARKVLLTAYADTDAAIQSINEIGLDHYLMKPWTPAEENLYPVLEDLLADWQALVELPYEGIRIAGTLWSPHSHIIKDFLSRNQVAYQWLDIEIDSQAEQLVKSVVGDDKLRLPVIFFPDGTTLIQPENNELAQKIGMHANATQPFYDLAIIGGGPAGLGAAVYAGSEGLQTVLIEKHATGGQAGSSSRIENYLGFPKGLSGADLARRATAQARRFGVEILLPREAVSVRLEDPYKCIQLSDRSEIRCRALVLATGVSNRQLEAPGIEKLTGAGIYYGATLSEAVLYRNQEVYLVGGANSAGQAAVHFARYARRVTLLVRSTSLEAGMSQYLVDQIGEIENIRVLLQTTVVEAHGERKLEALTIVNHATNVQETLEAAALFLFIGAVPHTEAVADIVLRNSSGFILTGQDLMTHKDFKKHWKLKRAPYYLETSVPGIFAAGDVRQGSVKRVAAGVGEGGVVVALVHQYLRTV